MFVFCVLIVYFHHALFSGCSYFRRPTNRGLMPLLHFLLLSHFHIGIGVGPSHSCCPLHIFDFVCVCSVELDVKSWYSNQPPSPYLARLTSVKRDGFFAVYS
ncbi:hypothetical protein K439DRAFT_782081 [Ramaria rubella]|nr:hypothetical protein K439DRAFT_782081 [Ramaria rubella]